MTNELREIIGSRGEKILELCLTDYRAFDAPLFRPGFLGDKWPAIDYYVELTSVPGKRLYFFAQAKATGAPLTSKARSLRISTKKADIDHLLEIPGPTYLFGVHEPSRRVFVRSVHSGMPSKAIHQISIRHELTSANLRILHEEVRSYWASRDHKPAASVFL
jgi:hypothetical protein